MKIYYPEHEIDEFLDIYEKRIVFIDVSRFCDQITSANVRDVIREIMDKIDPYVWTGLFDDGKPIVVPNFILDFKGVSFPHVLDATVETFVIDVIHDIYIAYLQAFGVYAPNRIRFANLETTDQTKTLIDWNAHVYYDKAIEVVKKMIDDALPSKEHMYQPDESNPDLLI